MQRREAKAKSGRKPLGELSNAHNNGNGDVRSNGAGKLSLKPAIAQKNLLSSEKKMEEKIVEGRAEVEDDDVLDRLLLVQSDLSSLTHQIDELVVEAFNLKAVSNQGRKEIESFNVFLSEIISSLKPWAARFKKTLSTPPKETENVIEQGLPIISQSEEDDKSISVDSPEQTDLDSLISPSPLVSWRANCTVDRSRQLFLLTPLPISKALSSKCQESSTTAIKKLTPASAPVSSLITIPQETINDLLNSGPINPDQNEPSESVGMKDAAEEQVFVSPMVVSKRDCSMFMMTPGFKVSPPKSCMLLEPISEISHWRDCNTRKATPFPVGIQSSVGAESSESSASESSADLAMKYPELLGIRRASKLGPIKKEIESSPDWFVSPPKSCILMEPVDEKAMNVAATNCNSTNPAPLQTHAAKFSFPSANLDHDNVQATRQTEPLNRKLALIDCTPVWKEPESTFGKGRRPGENTLKKELWTKFEAASSYGFHLSSSAAMDTQKKGFLDRLEEVSLDGGSPTTEACS